MSFACSQRCNSGRIPHPCRMSSDPPDQRRPHGPHPLGQARTVRAQEIPRRQREGPQTRVLHALRSRTPHVPRGRDGPHGTVPILLFDPPFLQRDLARRSGSPDAERTPGRHPHPRLLQDPADAEADGLCAAAPLLLPAAERGGPLSRPTCRTEFRGNESRYCGTGRMTGLSQ